MGGSGGDGDGSRGGRETNELACEQVVSDSASSANSAGALRALPSAHAAACIIGMAVKGMKG